MRPILNQSHLSKEKIHLTRPFTSSGWRDLNSRPLDPQSSAIRSPKFVLVHLPCSDVDLYCSERY